MPAFAEADGAAGVIAPTPVEERLLDEIAMTDEARMPTALLQSGHASGADQ
jgi:hypothetical protein